MAHVFGEPIVDPLQAALSLLQPDETAAQFLARTFAEQIFTGVPLLDHRSPLRATHVLEISGLAGTGKTELLYSIAATFILPGIKDGINYGGYGSNVLYFDLDCKFDIVRMAHVLQTRVHDAHISAGIDPSQTTDVLQLLVRESVGRLHIISCPSSFHFLASLKVIKPVATTLTQQGGLAAVLVDNVTAHYYMDRAAKGGVSGSGAILSDGSSSLSSSLTLAKVHTAMAAGLRHLQHELRVPIIATKHALSATGGRNYGGSSGTNDAWSYREVMLKPWLDLVTQRLVLRQVGRGHTESSQRIARWIKPEVGIDDKFMIYDGGVRPA